MNTLWLFNIAMENCPFIDDFPIKTSIYKGFPDGMWVITLNGKSDFVISQPWPALRIPAFILFRSRWTKGGVLLWRKVTWAVAASLLGWRRSSLWDVFTYTCRAIRKYRRYTSRTCISYILPGKKRVYTTHTYMYIYIYVYYIIIIIIIITIIIIMCMYIYIYIARYTLHDYLHHDARLFLPIFPLSQRTPSETWRFERGWLLENSPKNPWRMGGMDGLNWNGLNNIIEGSLEVKLPTICTDEKQSKEEAERRERLEERR